MPSIAPAADSKRYFEKYILQIPPWEIPTAFIIPISLLSFSSCVMMRVRMHSIEIKSTTMLTSNITRIIMPSDKAFIMRIRGPVIVGPFSGSFAL